MDRRAVAAIATLDDDVRQALFGHIRAAGVPVSREEAAAAVGISRKLAAFHLDKMVAAGLLTVAAAPPGQRRVGRAPKLYRPAEHTISVCIPDREPELLANLLAQAVESAAGEPPLEAARRVAEERGRDVGDAERRRTRPGRLGAERALTAAAAVLARHGFDPARSPGRVQLRNCPFHPVAHRHPQLVCGMNEAFCSGLIVGLRADDVIDARLEPSAESCCVQLHAR